MMNGKFIGETNYANFEKLVFARYFFKITIDENIERI